MCGIVMSTNKTSPDISALAVMSGLKLLEYRGYDSAGIAAANGSISVRKEHGKLINLEAELAKNPLPSDVKAIIGHTRWATHGPATKLNAHPHVVENVAVVHNGIIENHEQLRLELEVNGATFQSDTDTEVIAQLIAYELRFDNELLLAVRKAVARLEGTYAIGVISSVAPDTVIAVRQGSPLVVGIGDGHNMVASDALAIAEYTPEVMYLENGDLAVVTPNDVVILDVNGELANRPTKLVESASLVDKGDFRDFMLKEIYEQPDAVRNTLTLDLSAFGAGIETVLAETRAIHFIACGTSKNAADTARRWFTKLGIQTEVFIASQYRDEEFLFIPEGTLCIAISQSGETADTLRAMRRAAQHDYLATLAICNSPESSVVREADFCFITNAGREVAVASTKAFTTQLVALQLLAGHLSTVRGIGTPHMHQALRELPMQIEHVLGQSHVIEQAASHYRTVKDAFILGRREMTTIANEGALKLMEIAYVNVHGYASGEMKHGPIALVDDNFLTVAIVMKDGLEAKVGDSIQEVRARGSKVLVFAENEAAVPNNDKIIVVRLGKLNRLTAEYIVNVALQLFAYHMAVLRGHDVDQPRNLAKSVTVE